MIKQKVKTQKNLVKDLRTIRDKVNLDIQSMNLEEEKNYINNLLAQWQDAPKYGK